MADEISCILDLVGTTFPLEITTAGILHMTQMLMVSWRTRSDSQRTRRTREVLSLKTTQMSRSSLRLTLNWSLQSTLPNSAVPLRTGIDQEDCELGMGIAKNFVSRYITIFFLNIVIISRYYRTLHFFLFFSYFQYSLSLLPHRCQIWFILNNNLY